MRQATRDSARPVPAISLTEPKTSSIRELARIARGTTGAPLSDARELDAAHTAGPAFPHVGHAVPHRLDGIGHARRSNRKFKVLTVIGLALALGCLGSAAHFLTGPSSSQRLSGLTTALAPIAAQFSAEISQAHLQAAITNPQDLGSLAIEPDPAATIATAATLIRVSRLATGAVSARLPFSTRAAPAIAGKRHVLAHGRTAGAGHAARRHGAEPSSEPVAWVVVVPETAQESTLTTGVHSAAADSMVATDPATDKAQPALGRFSSDAVEQAMKIKRSAVVSCARENGVDGLIVLSFTVAPTGLIRNVEVRGHSDGPFSTCVARHVQALCVPPFDGPPSAFSYPIRIPRAQADRASRSRRRSS